MWTCPAWAARPPNLTPSSNSLRNTAFLPSAWPSRSSSPRSATLPRCSALSPTIAGAAFSLPSTTWALLLTTATHVCLNRIRGERRKPEDRNDEMLLHIAALEPHGNAEGRTLAGRILDHLFAGQPESPRLIAVLHYVDRLTLEEVASEVGMSVSGVRKRLRTLKERLPAVKGEA